MRLGSACWQSSRFNRAHYSIPRVQKLCESRGGRPGLPVHYSPYGLCGQSSKATLKKKKKKEEEEEEEEEDEDEDEDEEDEKKKKKKKFN